ncbi:hypothetical protein NG42_11975 [Winslowiella iniecta]|uniref:Tn3 transposase DDE domain-containing protein n=1 Tax=Winslowiella iniecta TaxID=1560201 RepID=A0A0L7TEW6_9GAMM|nr:hypothetical protein NG42_11975 [Winslowiella iniecta]KOC93888.1 hypothetical protein NG43_07970 [Winslowiella iniecta]
MLENQSYRASGLTLLTAAISLWNTVYIERAIDSLRRKGIPINEQLISHLSPLGWEHINLSGDYVWRTNLKLGQGKYRSLRSVDSGMYKKQAWRRIFSVFQAGPNKVYPARKSLAEAHRLSGAGAVKTVIYPDIYGGRGG